MAVTSEQVSVAPSATLDASDIAFRGLSWWQVRLGALALYGGVLAFFIVAIGIPLDRVAVTIWILIGLSIAALGKGWRAWGRIMLDWLPFQGILLAYDYSYGVAGRYSSTGFPHEGDTNVFGFPLHVTLPIDADRFMFGGTLPTQWVQAHIGEGPAVPWYAAIITLVYVSHFVVTPLVATWLWIRARDRFRVWIRLVLALSVAGLITYFVFPMTPPWLASQQSYIGGAPVERMSSEGWQVMGLHIADQVLNDSQARSNPVAAMPSLHMAFATLAAGFFILSVRRWWVRLLLLAYPAAMAFTLVYSGEHYVIDEIAGAVYALIALGVWRWWRARSYRAAADGDTFLGRSKKAEAESPDAERISAQTA